MKMNDPSAFENIRAALQAKQVQLVAVSKTKSVEEILHLYDLGQRDFGENYVQELVEKQASLPKEIRWHFIGHLQTNKVKFIAGFIYMIQSVDSLKLLKEIDKQAQKNNRVIDCLLQIHVAVEETKFGLDEDEFQQLSTQLEHESLLNLRIAGIMGMASFTSDQHKIRSEFHKLRSLLDQYKALFNPMSGSALLSMGMSSDYELAIEEGSNMVRIGSLIFGERTK
jgi:PLP dependent protein